ncbi:hypothetical protein AX15_001222 [Amanita polypyramis BW_CC]|nr:hypothetical protein AX15_001222 [Amanita polypyramis BW_CC]
MSAIPRILPAFRRSYSSFFSSKSGGGRYFNSAKTPKSLAITASARRGSKSSPAVPASKPSKSPQDGGDVKHHQSGKTSSEPVDAQSTNVSQSSSNSSPSGIKASHSGDTSTSQGEHESPGSSGLSDEVAAPRFPPGYPTMYAKDFELLRFFSMHRPLLLLLNPSSVLHPVMPSNSLLSTTGLSSSDEQFFTSDTSGLPPAPSTILSSAYYNSSSIVSTYDNVSKLSSDGELEVSCQISRALAMTKGGAMVEWEEILRRLGLDVDMEPERVERKVQMEKELEEIKMDSTKRKRGKKMKKHKLKKRRRLTRATRLKIGR